MAQAQNSVIKFYRGGLTNSGEAALPSKKDGAIFIIQTNRSSSESGVDFYGDMYVDTSDATRLQIKPDDAVYFMTKSERQASNEIAVPGRVYVISDYEEVTYTVGGQTKHGYKPAVIVGDSGGAYIRDLPVYKVITTEDEQYWNNKVTAYAQKINFENNSALDGNDYNLYLTLDNHNPLQRNKEG